MATLLIRNLDDTVRDKLRVRAAERGRSMEEEARTILADAVDASDVNFDDQPGSGAALLAEVRAAFAHIAPEDIDEWIANTENLPLAPYEAPQIGDDEDK